MLASYAKNGLKFVLDQTYRLKKVGAHLNTFHTNTAKYCVTVFFFCNFPEKYSRPERHLPSSVGCCLVVLCFNILLVSKTCFPSQEPPLDIIVRFSMRPKVDVLNLRVTPLREAPLP